MGNRRGHSMTRNIPSEIRTRGYDRLFDWEYEGPPAPPRRDLIPIIWDGLWLNTGDTNDGLCVVVENLSGWLDSPPLEGNDVSRVISDGAAWGPKVLRQRIITISGGATGPRAALMRFRDDLAVRAARREPTLLAVGDWDLERVLTADVRAGSEAYRHRPLGATGFKYQITLTAADPALYAGTWQTAELTNITANTGRDYPREYPWQYAAPFLPNSGVLRNGGNYQAPVYALYTGELGESAITDGRSGTVRIARLDAGMQILVNCSALTAEAEGGLSRASYILPGSRPLFIAAGDSSRWFLRSAGGGSVLLGWRSTWV